MQLPEMECPNCGAPVTDLSDEETIHCRYCGTGLNVYRSVCPYCDLINQPETNYCTRCGSSLVRVCPACQHENWAGLEYCAKCGRILDILEIMTKSRFQDTRARLDRQQSNATEIKRQEAAQGGERLEHFWQMERERLGRIAKQAAAGRRRERRAIAAVLIFLALCVMAIVIASMLRMGVGQ